MNRMLTPIKKSGKQVLYIQIADAIMEYIKSKHLVVGDKLPSERILSDSLKISRNSVREALRFLETQGIITVHTGIGSFIANDCSNRSVSLQFTQLNYQETLEIKTTLEIMLVGKLVQTITQEQLDHLDSLLAAMSTESSRRLLFHETDLKFHEYLCQLSPNATLRNMISDMISTLDNFWSQFGGYPEDLFTETVRYHYAIVAGLHKRSFDSIKKAYEDMLYYDIELFVKFIKSFTNGAERVLNYEPTTK